IRTSSASEPSRCRQGNTRNQPGACSHRRRADEPSPSRSPVTRRDATVCGSHGRRSPMKVSFFETGRYQAPPALPREWPVPSGAYDPETGVQAYQGMVERARFVQKLGFDWVSLSEHHYSPRILTPSVPLSAAHIASQVEDIKIALLGPIVPVSNPI